MHCIPPTPQVASQADENWSPPLLATSARNDTGIEELIEAIDAHKAHSDPHRQPRRLTGEIEWVMQLFLKQHGEYGANALGGRAALRKAAKKRLESGGEPASALRKSQSQLSERALKHKATLRKKMSERPNMDIDIRYSHGYRYSPHRPNP